MSDFAISEVHDVLRVSVELRAPKKGELTWSVPALASADEALKIVISERDEWSAGEAGFGCRAARAQTPAFEQSCDDGTLLRNIVVRVERLPSP